MVNMKTNWNRVPFRRPRKSGPEGSKVDASGVGDATRPGAAGQIVTPVVAEHAAEPAVAETIAKRDGGRPSAAQSVDAVLVEVQQAVERGDASAAADLLETLGMTNGAEAYQREWLLALAAHLRGTGYCKELSELWASRGFIGPDDRFLVCGHFTQRRDGRARPVLSLVAGTVIARIDLQQAAEASALHFGEEHVPASFAEAIPFRARATAGATGTTDGEAFITSDGFDFPGAAHGPALNNMSQQGLRFEKARIAAGRIFSVDTLALLLDLLPTVEDMIDVAAFEYGIHDALGHSNGVNFFEKVKPECLSDATLRGFEEARADGVALELSPSVLGRELTEKMAASNLIMRLGMDAHRGGGIDSDTDVQASALLFKHLLDSSMWHVDEQGWFGLKQPSPEALYRSYQPLRHMAMEVTRSELEAGCVKAIPRLYTDRFSTGGRAVDQMFASRVVDRCRGLFTELR